MFRFNFDPATGILELTVTGFFFADAFDQFYADYARHAAAARARAGHLKVLVDARQSGVVPANVASRLAELEDEFLNQPGDRVAVLIQSSLLKLQVRRVFDVERTQSFLSPGAARTWLLADVLETPSPPGATPVSAGSPVHA